MNATAPTRPRLLSMGSTYSEFDEESSGKASPPLLSRHSLRRLIRVSALLSLFFFVLYILRNHFRAQPPSSLSDSTDTANDDDKANKAHDDPVSPVYPPTNPTELHIHDPSIIITYSHPEPQPDQNSNPKPNAAHQTRTARPVKTYYAYGSGPHIPIHTAPALSGPWTKIGTVLTTDSVLPIGDRKAPWAPTVVAHNGTYYCYYATSHSGCRRSAIGVATSSDPGPRGWVDHGVIIRSGVGTGSGLYPMDRANAIDVSVIITSLPPEEKEPQKEEDVGDKTHPRLLFSREEIPQTEGEGKGEDPNPLSTSPSSPKPTEKKGYLTFGSFWTGIWQIPLTPDLLGSDYTGNREVRHLAHEPRAVHPPIPKSNGICGDPTGMHPVEGPFISYRAPWYYLWFSWGKCCGFKPERLPRKGMEYSIRVGRSRSPRGPFVDKQGRDLVEGGGEVAYGSNGEVYAPGGQGVLVHRRYDDVLGVEVEEDVLYYHYLNTSVGYEFHEARLGYNVLDYVDGWPVPV
ncbi:Arabinanase/levansucrase/invertase [Aspergillus brunneoviolaceus CBS 621.78]|uniref:Arabinanase/levansucrase/invertase n=1 Tax=Aspergillus brunneoviolaceus CBS 621.78 TaxID=1450534 RepID=A0ACD1GHC3_9EURO|nr:Arabinanase/levansucrase/invertase [Aspergillus brunneoviolaceus CBS 621.78]RAH48632.1 Arabinanase/levansucrase/invertase [Aspergillus brunneoviolaceus CBS 621.78]